VKEWIAKGRPRIPLQEGLVEKEKGTKMSILFYPLHDNPSGGKGEREIERGEIGIQERRQGDESTRH